MELFARQQSRAEWSSLEEDPTAGHGSSCATPVRGRTPETLWGLPHLDQAAQTQLDDDSILILRQIYITSLARASRAAVSLSGPRSFLEHPEDPVVSSSLPKAKECSSFWITEEGQLWMEENSLTAISFDQCRLGQLVKKATTLATDLPMQDWDQMRCTHQSSQFPGNPKEPPKGRGSDPIPPGENGDPVKEAVPPHHTRAQSPEARTPRSPACGTTGEGGTGGPGPGPPRMPARFQGPRRLSNWENFPIGYFGRPDHDPYPALD